MSKQQWPALPLSDWQDTYEMVHRLVQMAGKTRLQFSPQQNHWWHTCLYLTPRGLTTSPMWDRDVEFQVDFDFIDHAVVIARSDGEKKQIALRERPVAEFYREYVSTLASLGVECRMYTVPMELVDTIRFDEDTVHSAYDPDAMNRCWRVMAESDRVFKMFRGKFLGKSSPSHFWWGAFDLACTRFSGRGAPVHPGGVPNTPDFVTREAYSHECMSVGWWPGSSTGVTEPAFYAYAYPEPAGCATAPVSLPGGYNVQMREWILPYEAVRLSDSPADVVMQFCDTTYAAAADLGGWNRRELER